MKANSTMTLHDLAIQWVAERTRGIITHRRVGERRVVAKSDCASDDYPLTWNFAPPLLASFEIGHLEPDVIQTNRQGQGRTLHEVEVLGLREQKIHQYGSAKKDKVLWIVLPRGTSDVFNIHFIEPTDGEGTFKELGTVKKKQTLDELIEE
ncbi:MAG: hypothetical protein ABSG57_07750 [Candidatus Bathyarchaeia archaeon]